MDLQLKSKFDKHVTPCSQRFEQKGEKAEWRTAAFIVDNLSTNRVGNFRILLNYNLSRGQKTVNALEIDLVVINRYGVFLIEVKDWRGPISAHDGYWMQGEDRKHDDIFGVVENKAKRLHGKLFGKHGELEHLGAVSVTGLIVLYRGTQSFRNESQIFKYSRNVFGLGTELKIALSSTEFLHRDQNSQMLDDDGIHQVYDTLYKSHAPGEKIIRNYRFEKELLPGDLFDAFEAVNTTLVNRRVRIKRYQLLDLSDNTNQKIVNFQRNAEAVSKLEPHSNIVQTFDFFEDSNRANLYYEITELVRGERLDSLMQRCDQALPFDQQRLILLSLCEALDHAHTQHVYHRNLNPETIFISESGIVKLADFDFAKVEGLQTVSIHGSVLVKNLLTAPELRANSSKALPQSDLYSLGGLWYLLAALPDHPIDINLDLIPQFGLHEQAQTLMKQILSKAPYQRPASGREVKNQLNMIPN
jgi:hypothetical protein